MKIFLALLIVLSCKSVLADANRFKLSLEVGSGKSTATDYPIVSYTDRGKYIDYANPIPKSEKSDKYTVSPYNVSNYKFAIKGNYIIKIADEMNVGIAPDLKVELSTGDNGENIRKSITGHVLQGARLNVHDVNFTFFNFGLNFQSNKDQKYKSNNITLSLVRVEFETELKLKGIDPRLVLCGAVELLQINIGTSKIGESRSTLWWRNDINEQAPATNAVVCAKVKWGNFFISNTFAANSTHFEGFPHPRNGVSEGIIPHHSISNSARFGAEMKFGQSFNTEFSLGHTYSNEAVGTRVITSNIIGAQVSVSAKK